MTIKIIYIDEVEKLTELTRQTIWRYCKENKFPKPFKRGNKNAWEIIKINEWLRDNADGKLL